MTIGEKPFPRRRRCCAIRWLKYSRRRSAQWESGDARGISTTSSVCVRSDRRFGQTPAEVRPVLVAEVRAQRRFRFRTLESRPRCSRRSAELQAPSGGNMLDRQMAVVPSARRVRGANSRPSSAGSTACDETHAAVRAVDASRLNRPPTGRTGALRRSALRFGRNTPGMSSLTRSLSAGRPRPALGATARVPPPAVKPEKC